MTSSTRASMFSNVKLDGVMTHFASADDPDKAEFTRQQIARFESAVRTVRARGHEPPGFTKRTARPLTLTRGARQSGQARRRALRLVARCDQSHVAAARLATGSLLRTRIMLLKTVPAGTPLGYGGTFVTGGRAALQRLPSVTRTDSAARFRTAGACWSAASLRQSSAVSAWT